MPETPGTLVVHEGKVFETDQKAKQKSGMAGFRFSYPQILCLELAAKKDMATRHCRFPH